MSRKRKHICPSRMTGTSTRGASYVEAKLSADGSARLASIGQFTEQADGSRIYDRADIRIKSPQAGASLASRGLVKVSAGGSASTSAGEERYTLALRSPDGINAHERALDSLRSLASMYRFKFAIQPNTDETTVLVRITSRRKLSDRAWAQLTCLDDVSASYWQYRPASSGTNEFCPVPEATRRKLASAKRADKRARLAQADAFLPDCDKLRAGEVNRRMSEGRGITLGTVQTTDSLGSYIGRVDTIVAGGLPAPMVKRETGANDGRTPSFRSLLEARALQSAESANDANYAPQSRIRASESNRPAHGSKGTEYKLNKWGVEE